MTSPTDWINTLATASIAADMRAAIVNGEVTAAGLVTLLTDIAQASPTVTAAEFSDLKIIAANLNTDGLASPALAFVFNALVNGDSHNALWTDGSMTPQALGNLSVGSSADTLTKLTSKWLQGGDLPLWIFTDFGVQSAGDWWAPTGPLFGPNGPSMDDINQGNVGDCTLEAIMAQYAAVDPNVVSGMFTDLGGGVYAVRFFTDGKASYVTINNLLPNGGLQFNNGPDTWASLLERAYVEFRADQTGVDCYNQNINDLDVAQTLAAVTGATSLAYYAADTGSWDAYIADWHGNLSYASITLSTTTLLAMVAAAVGAGQGVIAESQVYDYDANDNLTLIKNHAFSVYGYDAATKELMLRNPWGNETPDPNNPNWKQGYDTTFEMSIQQLLSDNVGIDIAAPVYNGALSLTAALFDSFVDGLNKDATVKSITLTDPGTPVLSLSNNQVALDAALLSKITNPTFDVLTENGDTTYYTSANLNLTFNNSASICVEGASDRAVIAGGWSTLTLSGVNDVGWVSGADSKLTIAASATGASATLTSNNDTADVSAASATDSLWGAAETATLWGVKETVYVASDNDTAALNGASEIAVLYNTGNVVYAQGARAALTLNGDTESSYIYGDNGTATLSGKSDSVEFDGAKGTANLWGASDTAWLKGTSDTVDLDAASQSANAYGAKDSVVMWCAGDNAGLIGASETAVLNGAGEGVWLDGVSESVTIAAANTSVNVMTLLGADTVKGFTGTSSLYISHDVFANWNALSSHAKQSKQDTIITLDPADTLTLKNVALSSLAAQTHFV